MSVVLKVVAEHHFAPAPAYDPGASGIAQRIDRRFVAFLRCRRLKWPLVCLFGSMSKITEASRDHIADENFAFPKERKEPIHDAAHVRNAIARFKQVQGVTDSERDAAWNRIKSAAKKHRVELHEQDWRELS